MQLIIGNKNYSSWSLRPWLALAKSGLIFNEKVISLLDPTRFKLAIQAYSPAGLVPVLIDGEIIIHDSLAIMEYVAELSPQLWPREKNQRALARAYSAEMHAGFLQIRKTMPMNVRGNDRHVDISTECDTEIKRVHDIWSHCLSLSGGPWLMGEFSILDAMYAPIVCRFETYNIKTAEPLLMAYRQQVLNDEDMLHWIAEAKNEQEAIPASEVGSD